MLPYEKLIQFPEYKSISREQYDELCKRSNSVSPLDLVNGSPVEKDSDNILNLIFAPDPVSGIPRSDLAVMYSKDTAPEISQYVRDTLMQPIAPSITDENGNPVFCPDADAALDTMRNKGESFVEYAERLRSFGKSNDDD